MRLESLYRVKSVYPEGWSVELAGEHGTEWQDRWLNDTVCVGTGEVRSRPDGDGSDLVVDVAELIWEPPAEASSSAAGPPSA